MSHFHVKPSSPELVIRDPRSGVRLPPNGRRVPMSPFWVRRLRCGDVVEVDDSPEAPKKKRRKARKTAEPEQANDPITEVAEDAIETSANTKE